MYATSAFAVCNLATFQRLNRTLRTIITIFLLSSGFDPEVQIGDDGKFYATLSYANGPGFLYHRTANGSLATEQPRKALVENTNETRMQLVTII